eukprot:7646807-Alexandrium_andersonii.AAC.1
MPEGQGRVRMRYQEEGTATGQGGQADMRTGSCGHACPGHMVPCRALAPPRQAHRAISQKLATPSTADPAPGLDPADHGLGVRPHSRWRCGTKPGTVDRPGTAGVVGCAP